jgi:hypothetical protein
MSTVTDSLPQRIIARIAVRQAARQAVDRHHFKSLVLALSDQLNDHGLIANDQRLEDVIGSDSVRAIAAAVGFGPVDVIRHVSLIRGQRRAVALVQQSRNETDPAAADRLRAEAETLLSEIGVSNAAKKVSRLDQRLTESKAAVEASQAAIAAEQTAAWEAQAFGNRTANTFPGADRLSAIDKHRAAEATAHSTFMAMLDARKKVLAAINRMTTVDLFGDAAAADDDDGDDNDDPPAADGTPAEPIAWEDACGIESTGPAGK